MPLGTITAISPAISTAVSAIISSFPLTATISIVILNAFISNNYTFTRYNLFFSSNVPTTPAAYTVNLLKNNQIVTIFTINAGTTLTPVDTTFIYTQSGNLATPVSVSPGDNLFITISGDNNSANNYTLTLY
jgi:hypothetical protein